MYGTEFVGALASYKIVRIARRRANAVRLFFYDRYKGNGMQANTISRTDKLGSGWMVMAALFFALMGGLVKKAGQDFDFGFYESVLVGTKEIRFL